MNRNYAIMRVEKVKSLAAIAAMSAHWRRTRPTPNANPKRKSNNRVLQGAVDPYKAFQELIAERGISKFRKNGVLLLEFVLAFSPRYLRDENGKYQPDASKKLKDWINASLSWIKQEFGDKCISIHLHGDESNYHLHFAVVPLELKTRKCGTQEWALNARGITGGSNKLRKLQDSYADSVKQLGLHRGMKGSKAQHEDIKAFYSALNHAKEDLQSINAPIPKPHPKKVNIWHERMLQVVSALKQAQNDERSKLQRMVAELTRTNQKLRSELIKRSNVKSRLV
ncbi:plasmid recombination protein [Pseudoalteromonas sp. MM17-2]|uniref:MobV family relaxase n=1 Tax=Pseudoalteromonas sp. MM17-2 TaxID=2917753 RepID=UPI001EF43C42|nr:MobV family relaxase [Pseudoalteromonas sp. MM17-2]MCG7546259.1 plasmid recombination protein [Pseudoalteromonas sp. MM17-2]